MGIAARGEKKPSRYPISGFQRLSTIYGYLRTVVPILKILGLCPARKVYENGIMKYKPSLGLLYLLQIFCECTLVTFLVIYLARNNYEKITGLYSLNAMELFACIMFGSHTIAAKIEIIICRKEYMESFDGIYEVDLFYKKLGIKISYEKLIKFCRRSIIIFCVIYSALLVIAFQNKVHFIALLLQLWRTASINMYNLFLILLYTKYRSLNNFLKLYIQENEEGIPLTDTNMEPLEVINTVAEVYDKLCICGQNWNDINNVALSINLLFYAVSTILYSIAYYTSPSEMFSVLPVFIFFFLEFFYILTVSQVTRNECKKIMLNVNEMSCCYVDNDLWRARNSFLLQTLHQRVNFTVMHVFPLDYTMAIKIGGVVLSVFVLTIQIRSLEEAQ